MLHFKYIKLFLAFLFILGAFINLEQKLDNLTTIFQQFVQDSKTTNFIQKTETINAKEKVNIFQLFWKYLSVFLTFFTICEKSIALGRSIKGYYSTLPPGAFPFNIITVLKDKLITYLRNKANSAIVSYIAAKYDLCRQVLAVSFPAVKTSIWALFQIVYLMIQAGFELINTGLKTALPFSQIITFIEKQLGLKIVKRRSINEPESGGDPHPNGLDNGNPHLPEGASGHNNFSDQGGSNDLLPNPHLPLTSSDSRSYISALETDSEPFYSPLALEEPDQHVTEIEHINSAQEITLIAVTSLIQPAEISEIVIELNCFNKLKHKLKSLLNKFNCIKKPQLSNAELNDTSLDFQNNSSLEITSRADL